MRRVDDKLQGPVLIEEDLAVHGIVTGDATLSSGAKLVLHGTITGDLIIEPRAKAIIHGTVNGMVINDGGRAEIFGTVDVIMDRSPEAVTVVDPVASVRVRR